MRSLILCCLLSFPAMAQVEIGGASFPQTTKTAGSALELQGAGLLKWRGLVSVYAAALYRESPSSLAPFTQTETHKIEIEYFRDIDRADLQKATRVAFEKALPNGESVADWQNQLDAFIEAYQGVAQGDRYTLVVGPEGYELRLNQKILSSNDDAVFAQRLVNMWTGENSPTQKLRSQLLALN